MKVNTPKPAAVASLPPIMVIKFYLDSGNEVQNLNVFHAVGYFSVWITHRVGFRNAVYKSKEPSSDR